MLWRSELRGYFMKLRYSFLVSAATAMTLSVPAAACEFDGLPGMGGFHRMNPFAKALGEYNAPRPLPAPQPTVEEPDKPDEKKTVDIKAEERKKRTKAIGAAPVREAELDNSTSPISKEGKATLT